MVYGVLSRELLGQPRGSQVLRGSSSFTQKYINTSFFLVYDYNAKQIGANPYQAYRLTDRFALKEEFPLSELASLTLKKENPLEKIPAFVQKDELFEALMSFNKKKFI